MNPTKTSILERLVAIWKLRIDDVDGTVKIAIFVICQVPKPPASVNRAQEGSARTCLETLAFCSVERPQQGRTYCCYKSFLPIHSIAAAPVEPPS